MNIASILSKQADARASSVAIIDTKANGERLTSFADLDYQAAQLAQLLRSSGLKKGDAVLVFQSMSAELYALLTALFRLGLIAVFIDPSAEKGHLERCCKLYPPKALVASPKAHLLRFLSAELRRIPLKFSFARCLPFTKSLGFSKTQLRLNEIEDCAANTPALMTFTSGSTGQPKAAVRTHGFLIAQHQALAKSLELQTGETDVSTLPIFVLANLASGVTSLIPNADLRKPGSVDPAPIVQQIKHHKPERLSASPAFLERIVEHCESKKITLEPLEKVFTGGAPVFPSLLERAQGVFLAASVTGVYGSTEAEPIAHIAWHDLSDADKQAMRLGKGLLTGKPTDDINVRIIKNQWGIALATLTQEAFDAMTLRSKAGEIVVNGEHVLNGYLNGVGDEETKFDVAKERWHRTGDLGYLDDKGRLWLLGRASAMIQDDKGTLYPFALECAASHFEAIKRSAAMNHKNKRLLIIELREDRNVDKQQLKEQLEWAELDDILFMQLPVDKRHNAKIDYPELTKKLERVN